jgi:hypothetical protein
VSKQRRLTPIPSEPVKTQRSIDDVIDTIEAKRAQAEWEDTLRLAESIFPTEWNVRVEPFSDGVNVQVRYYVARGRTATEALRNAIEWYRGKGGSRIILPGQEGR